MSVTFNVGRDGMQLLAAGEASHGRNRGIPTLPTIPNRNPPQPFCAVFQRTSKQAPKCPAKGENQDSRRRTNKRMTLGDRNGGAGCLHVVSVVYQMQKADVMMMATYVVTKITNLGRIKRRKNLAIDQWSSPCAKR